MAKFIKKCPHCGTDLSVSDEWIGRTIECSVCGKKFVLQSPQNVNKEITFTYTAMDGKGREHRGRINAENEAAAADLLKSRGLFPTSIQKATGHSLLGRILYSETLPQKVNKGISSKFLCVVAIIVILGVLIVSNLEVLIVPKTHQSSKPAPAPAENKAVSTHQSPKKDSTPAEKKAVSTHQSSEKDHTGEIKVVSTHQSSKNGHTGEIVVTHVLIDNSNKECIPFSTGLLCPYDEVMSVSFVTARFNKKMVDIHTEAGSYAEKLLRDSERVYKFNADIFISRLKAIKTVAGYKTRNKTFVLKDVPEGRYSLVVLAEYGSQRFCWCNEINIKKDRSVKIVCSNDVTCLIFN